MPAVPGSAPRAAVIGGGLAGMCVARELARSGFRVTLLEATYRLGGKAGADLRDGRYVEHGYHVFPGWYRNTRALLAELGIADRLIDLDRFAVLLPGCFPRVHTFHQFSPFTNLFRNLRSAILPWPQLLLTFYFVIDLQSQPWRYRGYLDRISVGGFLRSRFYASEQMAAFQQYTALQASSIPSYDLSSMSSQTVARAWMRTPAPLFSIFDRNLQAGFIEPFARALHEAGVEVRPLHRVTALRFTGRRVAGLELADGSVFATAPADVHVLATPLEATRALVDRELYSLEESFGAADELPRLSDLVKLESTPMASLVLYLNRKMADIPPVHVNLQGSRFGMSFIDLSPHWPALPRTTLSVIAADITPLCTLGEEEMRAYLLAELRRFVPIAESDIEDVFLHANLGAPLFLNTTGSWHYRPGTRTRIANLFVAGDYCRSQADLTTMESAIISAMNTARDILAEHGRSHAGPLPLRLAPRWLARLIKCAAFPVILPFGLWNWTQRVLRDR